MTEVTNTDAGWLSREDMDAARERLPILYVDAVPVRVDDEGTVTAVGLLLRIGKDGQVERALASGTGAVPRACPIGAAPYLEEDLGPLALPRVPPAPQQDALELTWFSPVEVREPTVLAELANGQSMLLLQALAHLGVSARRAVSQADQLRWGRPPRPPVTVPAETSRVLYCDGRWTRTPEMRGLHP